MNIRVGPYTERQIVIDESVPKRIQPAAVAQALWRTMKYFRRNSAPPKTGTTHRRAVRSELPLRTASLSSPIFVESWNGGSPLNWVEFLGRWEIRRTDRGGQGSDD